MTFDDFSKTELRIAKILVAERVTGSDKLVKLRISLGEAERGLVAGIGKAYDPENLVGREIAVVANLDPRVFKIKNDAGDVIQELTSEGMLLAAHDADGSPVLLSVEKDVPPGSIIS